MPLSLGLTDAAAVERAKFRYTAKALDEAADALGAAAAWLETVAERHRELGQMNLHELMKHKANETRAAQKAAKAAFRIAIGGT
jgi:hypothetical protein